MFKSRPKINLSSISTEKCSKSKPKISKSRPEKCLSPNQLKIFQSSDLKNV